jgi:hypothetical protein
MKVKPEQPEPRPLKAKKRPRDFATSMDVIAQPARPKGAKPEPKVRSWQWRDKRGPAVP